MSANHYHALLQPQNSFIAMHMSSLEHSSFSFQLLPLGDQKSDSSFFKMTPHNLLVTKEDVLNALPFGKMQYYIIFINFLLYPITSFLCYNYCFFLLAPHYTCTYVNANGIQYQESCSRE